MNKLTVSKLEFNTPTLKRISKKDKTDLVEYINEVIEIEFDNGYENGSCEGYDQGHKEALELAFEDPRLEELLTGIENYIENSPCLKDRFLDGLKEVLR